MKIKYDPEDVELLELIDGIFDHKGTSAQLRKLFDPSLHPRGIKELAAPRSLRIAFAMVDLLGALREESAAERLAALRAVHDEVLHDTESPLRHNTARVLLEITKALVRSREGDRARLNLAHDFNEVSSGKARLVRRQLKKYHLLEMPESWNQITFDHHVHDASTKGRKSPTHLIMDAWIKGIRSLGVVYYNFVKPEVAAELLEAAEIMGVDVRIGVEVAARLHDRRAHLVWAPRGFHNRDDFIAFLREPVVDRFMQQGQEVAAFRTEQIIRRLRRFNDEHLPQINRDFGIDVAPLDPQRFVQFVGHGQASLVHLAEFIHGALLPHLRRRGEQLSAEHAQADTSRRREIVQQIEQCNDLVPEELVERYLRSTADAEDVPGDEPDSGLSEQPDLLQLDAAAMIDRLEQLPCRSRITLNPSNLDAADVLRVIDAGRGRITHIEVFNLKDWAQNRVEHLEQINQVRLVLNRHKTWEVKQLLRDVVQELEAQDASANAPRIEALRQILAEVQRFASYYRQRRLQSRIGSDSTGRSRYSRGMGLAVVATLPASARRQLRRDRDRWLPVKTEAIRQLTFDEDPHLGGEGRWWRRRRPRVSWLKVPNATRIAAQGNIAALGGMPEESDNRITLDRGTDQAPASAPTPRSGVPLNTSLKNSLKVAVGFVPAFLTFYLTKDWWLLAYFGAPIWFAITGLRNILQSVVGGGGLRRSSLLRWNDFVSWSRVADSLLFTGFSVPLLDELVKHQLLSSFLGITTSTDPVALYAIMALANGIYISSHNLFRGLPSSAAAGNFFRSIASIPIAIGANAAIYALLVRSGVSSEAANHGLQLWAAVLSKACSDLVAALIEGSADRALNLRLRLQDYSEKLHEIYTANDQIEALYPEQDTACVVCQPDFFQDLARSTPKLLRSIAINALDGLYFWMYQPRGETAFRHLVRAMTPNERQVLEQSLLVLGCKRLISELLLAGLVGRRFEKPMAFYLSRSDRYVALCQRVLATEARGNGAEHLPPRRAQSADRVE